MRYLSQLARETTARTLPSRQPSWHPPTPAMAEESVVEWADPGAVDQVSDAHAEMRSPAAAPVPALHSAPGPSPRGDAAIEEAPFATLPVRSTVVSQGPVELLFDVLPPERASASVSATGTQAAEAQSAPPSIPLRHYRREPASPVTRETQGEVSPAKREKPATTLQSVLMEIERRQQRLEREYRETDSLSRREPRRAEGAATMATPHRENHEVRVNIGSIVVQVEPEPVAASAPARALKDSQPAFDNRWKRSFLDR